MLKNKNRGITLIALVVTVIVLLILAGVSISMLSGQNGILNRAGEAKEKTEASSMDEQRKIAQAEALMTTEKTTYKGVTLPDGFVPTKVEDEDTINDGLVITDGYGNEYVWIPVDDINNMIMCKNNNSESVCNLVYQDDNVLKCLTHDSTEFCGRIYDVDANFNQDFSQRNQVYQVEGLREPDIITIYDNDNNKNYLSMAGVLTAEHLSEQMQNDFNNMAKSVAKYKGFYISRYEIGENASSKRNQNVLTAISANNGNCIGANMWYGLYKTLRNVENTNVNRHMVWRMPV